MNTLDRLPTADETLFLRASVLRGDKAIAAWDTLRARFDLDMVEGDAYKLLPLLYENLRRHRIDDPWLPRLKGMRRLAWYQNQLLLRETAAVLRQLHANGVQTMLLKGTALVASGLMATGSRLIVDLDVLVPRDQLNEAVRVLTDLDRIPKLWEEGLEAHIATHNEIHFSSPNSFNVDVHWLLVDPMTLPVTARQKNDELWPDSVVVELDGVRSRVLAPADMLLHILLHGMVELHPEGCFRWAADSVAVLRGAGAAFPWKAFVSRTLRWHVTGPIYEALCYLQRSLDVAVPLPVSRRLALAARRWGLADRLERPPADAHSAVDFYRRLIAAHLRQTDDQSAAGAVRALPAFLRDRLGTDGLARFWTAAAIRRGGSRLSRIAESISRR